MSYSDNGSGDSVDEYVAPIGYSNNNPGSSPLHCTGAIDARPYVDGSNGQAEFYLKMEAENSDSVRIMIQD